VNPLFFLTRFEPTDDALAARASALGFMVLRVPLFTTEPGVDSPTIARRLAVVGEGVAVAWTSRRAAESLARSLTGPRRGGLERVPLYALGEESANPMGRAGYTPLTPGEGVGAAGLAQFILSRARQDGVRCVLFLRGDRSLPDLPNGLKAGGLDVFSLEVYRTRFLDADVEGLKTWLRNGDPVAAAFFSPSSVLALERLLDVKTRTQAHERVAAIARGHTTGQALEHQGYRSVFRPNASAGFEAAAQEALVSTSGGRP
jgi:uroporphyrinogen-III synthase